MQNKINTIIDFGRPKAQHMFKGEKQYNNIKIIKPLIRWFSHPNYYYFCKIYC